VLFFFISTKFLPSSRRSSDLCLRREVEPDRHATILIVLYIAINLPPRSDDALVFVEVPRELIERRRSTARRLSPSSVP